MRRQDRELTDRGAQRAILDACPVCRLAMVDGDRPYVVPLNFGYEWTGELPVLYFHCAGAGRKLDILQRAPKVCFEVDNDYTLTGEGARACSYGNTFSSLIGEGSTVILTEHKDKEHALQCLMRHATDREFTFTEKETSSVTVLAVQLTSLTGKQKR